jgi:hypothetical protein
MKPNPRRRSSHSAALSTGMHMPLVCAFHMSAFIIAAKCSKTNGDETKKRSATRSCNWTHRLPRHTTCAFLVKILPRIFLSGIDHLSVCVPDVCLCSGKWLVGPSSTRNLATSFFISLGYTWRCYGVLLSRTDTSDQRLARCWLPFFRKTGRNPSCHERSQNMLARC